LQQKIRLLTTKIRQYSFLSLFALFAAPVATWADQAPPLPAPDALIGQAWDSQGQRLIPVDAVAYRLAAARWVFLGEQHDSPEHHRLQARFVAAMVAAGRQPAVAFEMIENQQQTALDRLSGPPARPFAHWNQALRWQKRGWPAWSTYRPIFVEAIAAQLPLLAANLDRAGIRAAAQGPAPDLPPHIRAQYTAAVVTGHCDLIKAEQATPMVQAQVARDRTMAQAMIKGDQISNDGAILIAGAGHARRDSGAPWQLAQLAVSGPIISVAMIEVRPQRPGEPPATIADYQAAYAAPADTNDKGDAAPLDHAPFDYLVFTPRIERPDPCDALRRRFSGG
jgi:uncharacterized iron-regulated protein